MIHAAVSAPPGADTGRFFHAGLSRRVFLGGGQPARRPFVCVMQLASKNSGPAFIP